MKDEINKFSEYAINHHRYTQEGDWKKGNAEIKKINSIYKSIKKEGNEAMEKLLELIYSDKPEVSSLAATYCMRFSTDKCLAVLKNLSEKEIPLISFAAEYAIENWNKNEWYID